MNELRDLPGGISVSKLCRGFDHSYQAYYKGLRTLERRVETEEKIYNEVVRLRTEADFGGMTLWQLLNQMENGLSVGRDRLYRLLRERGLILKKPRRYARTTNSRHSYDRFPNLIKEAPKPVRSEEVLVSDMTYLRLANGGFCYLWLVTDLYSRRIMGYHVSEDMKGKWAIKALRKAIKSRKFPDREIVHHSDRGIQYCCDAHVDELRKHGVKISMAAKGNPYENAVAERINRTMKDLFRLGKVHSSVATARKATQRAVEFYCSYFPHSSLDYMSPMKAHDQEGPLKQRWSPRKRKNKDEWRPSPASKPPGRFELPG